jgi:hypothetical protein
MTSTPDIVRLIGGARLRKASNDKRGDITMGTMRCGLRMRSAFWWLRECDDAVRSFHP